MLTKRIIPCLDIRDGRVVKGVNFVDIRDAGDPVEAAVRYNQAGADELVLLDINASHEGRATMMDVVSRVAEQVFIRDNVRRIRRIQWCCCAVSLICVPASLAYLPLIFLVIIMAFLSLTVSVVASVMDAAVAIREENDLTI